MLPLFLCLKTKVFLVVFFIIRNCSVRRNALAGIIFKLVTPIVDRDHTVLYAEDRIVRELCAVNAVNTGTFDFFAEKHIEASFFEILYITGYKKSTPNFKDTPKYEIRLRGE